MKSIFTKLKRSENKIHPGVVKKLKTPKIRYKTKPTKLYMSVFDFLANSVGKFFVLSLETPEEEERMQDNLEEIYYNKYGYKKFIRSDDRSPIDIGVNESGRMKVVLDTYTTNIGVNILSALYSKYTNKSYRYDIEQTIEILLSLDFIKYILNNAGDKYEIDFAKFLKKEKDIIKMQIEKMLEQTEENIRKEREYFEKEEI